MLVVPPGDSSRLLFRMRMGLPLLSFISLDGHTDEQLVVTVFTKGYLWKRISSGNASLESRVGYKKAKKKDIHPSFLDDG